MLSSTYILFHTFWIGILMSFSTGFGFLIDEQGNLLKKPQVSEFPKNIFFNFALLFYFNLLLFIIVINFFFWQDLKVEYHNFDHEVVSSSHVTYWYLWFFVKGLLTFLSMHLYHIPTRFV